MGLWTTHPHLCLFRDLVYEFQEAIKVVEKRKLNFCLWDPYKARKHVLPFPTNKRNNISEENNWLFFCYWVVKKNAFYSILKIISKETLVDRFF